MVSRSPLKSPHLEPKIVGLPNVLPLIEQVLSQAKWDQPAIGGPRFPSARRGDPAVHCHPYPRLTVILRGRMRYGLSICGERSMVDGVPGQIFYWATNGWNLDFWDTACEFLGLVFHPRYLRVLHVTFPGGAPPREAARTAHHTHGPIPSPAKQLLGTLDSLADSGPPPELMKSCGHVLRGLVGFAYHHVQQDITGVSQEGSLRTWQDAIEYVTENLLAMPILSRESVAKALGLHPNYVSSLFTRHGGTSFARTVESMRIERAKNFLRLDPKMSVAEVGRLSGYSDPGHFIRVFKRSVGRTPGRFARTHNH